MLWERSRSRGIFVKVSLISFQLLDLPIMQTEIKDSTRCQQDGIFWGELQSLCYVLVRKKASLRSLGYLRQNHRRKAVNRYFAVSPNANPRCCFSRKDKVSRRFQRLHSTFDYNRKTVNPLTTRPRYTAHVVSLRRIKNLHRTAGRVTVEFRPLLVGYNLYSINPITCTHNKS